MSNNLKLFKFFYEQKTELKCFNGLTNQKNWNIFTSEKVNLSLKINSEDKKMIYVTENKYVIYIGNNKDKLEVNSNDLYDIKVFGNITKPEKENYHPYFNCYGKNIWYISMYNRRTNILQKSIKTQNR